MTDGHLGGKSGEGPGKAVNPAFQAGQQVPCIVQGVTRVKHGNIRILPMVQAEGYFLGLVICGDCTQPLQVATGKLELTEEQKIEKEAKETDKGILS